MVIQLEIEHSQINRSDKHFFNHVGKWEKKIHENRFLLIQYFRILFIETDND